MKKSKHFRKDVIIARVIAGVLVILFVLLIVLGISVVTKSSGNNKDTQNTQNTQNTQSTQITPDTSIDVVPETESQLELEQVTEVESESESVSNDKVYVISTSQIRLRKEPNTECTTIVLIDSGVKMEVLETLDGWYKVFYDGSEGYVSATYVEIAEE